MDFDIPAFLAFCRSRSVSLVTAESCTGGKIASRITDIPGSSDVLWGAYVTYANAAKTRMLGVPSSLIKEKGAVSSEVVQAMVQGALDNSGADVAVAVSGIAGPGGGTPEKPVGTVWFGAGLRGGRIFKKRCRWKGSRREIQEQAVEAVLKLCKKVILEET